METVSVLHQEFTDANQTTASTCFVAILGLELVEHERELLIARNDIAHEIRHGLFVGHRKDHVVVVAILKAEEFFANRRITTRFSPKFCGLHNGKIDFDAADGIHFLTDQVFDFFEDTEAHREVTIDTGGQRFDIAAAHEEDMTRHGGVARRFAERGIKELRELHSGR